MLGGSHQGGAVAVEQPRRIDVRRAAVASAARFETSRVPLTWENRHRSGW
jgi:hypothetical protein